MVTADDNKKNHSDGDDDDNNQKNHSDGYDDHGDYNDNQSDNNNKK